MSLPCYAWSADDGKRFQAMDVVLGLLLAENVQNRGGGLGEGGDGIAADELASGEQAGIRRTS